MQANPNPLRLASAPFPHVPPRKARRREQPEPTLHEIRQKYGAQLSDEDLILHYFAGEDYVKALPDHGKPREYLDATQPLVKIIEQVSKRKDSNQVYIKQPGFSIRMEKRTAVS